MQYVAYPLAWDPTVCSADSKGSTDMTGILRGSDAVHSSNRFSGASSRHYHHPAQLDVLFWDRSGGQGRDHPHRSVARPDLGPVQSSSQPHRGVLPSPNDFAGRVPWTLEHRICSYVRRCPLCRGAEAVRPMFTSLFCRDLGRRHRLEKQCGM